MVERTLVDEIISIIHSEANNNPLPVKCTIHETYSNGLIDVLLENGTILTYLPVIGSPRVGDTGVLLYLDDEKNNQIIITNGGGEVDLSNYIRKSSTSGLVKNDGSIDSNEYVTSQELHKNIPINYVVTSTDNTLTEDISTFIVGKDYYFVVRTFQGLNEVHISGIRCEIYHSGAIKDLTPVEFDNLSNVFKFTPMEQKGYILKVYDSDTLVATYTFDAIIDTGWQNVSFSEGYTNYSGDNLKIRRIGNIVEINGSWTALKDKTATSAPIQFATIDEMFRPESEVYVRQQGRGMNTYLLLVEPTGKVYWLKYGTNSSSNLTASDRYTCHALWTVNGGAVGGGSNCTGGSNVDLSNYYTKNETDNLLTDKLNTNLGVANKNVVTDENGNVSLEEKSGNNGFGSFYINDEGHLIAVIPSNVNPYKIIDGHLIYDTEAI